MSYEFRTTVLKVLASIFLRERLRGAQVNENSSDLSGAPDVRAARLWGPSQRASCFDLEQLRFGTFGINIATLPGSRFTCCRVWLRTLGNSPVEPVQRQSCHPLVAWGMLDRQCTARLRELCADRGCPI